MLKKMSYIAIALAVLLSVNIASVDSDSVHRDYEYHTKWDHTGDTLDTWEEAHGASEEDAQYLSIYYVYHIVDSDGNEHTLYMVGVYYEKDDEGNWVETGGWMATHEQQVEFASHFGE